MEKVKKNTFPLFQERIMAEGKGGQLLAQEGEPGLIMRGVGDVFFIRLFAVYTQKGKGAKRKVVLLSSSCEKN